MDDIVERLRNAYPATQDMEHTILGDLMDEAADTIVSLRAKLDSLDKHNKILERSNSHNSKVNEELYHENRWLRESGGEQNLRTAVDVIVKYANATALEMPEDYRKAVEKYLEPERDMK